MKVFLILALHVSQNWNNLRGCGFFRRPIAQMLGHQRTSSVQVLSLNHTYCSQGVTVYLSMLFFSHPNPLHLFLPISNPWVVSTWSFDDENMVKTATIMQELNFKRIRIMKFKRVLSLFFQPPLHILLENSDYLKTSWGNGTYIFAVRSGKGCYCSAENRDAL